CSLILSAQKNGRRLLMVEPAAGWIQIVTIASRAASSLGLSRRGGSVFGGSRDLVLGRSGQASQETFQLLAAHGVLQFANGLGFNLADAFPGHFEDAAHLFQGVGVAVAQAVAELDDLALAPGERLEQVIDLGPQHAARGLVERALTGVVLDELAEAAIFALAHRTVQAHRLAADV